MVQLTLCTYIIYYIIILYIIYINNPSSTLIDNIFTSNTDHVDSCISGVLTEKLSDHQSYLHITSKYHILKKFPNMLKLKKRDAFSIDQFITELKKKEYI